MMKRITGLLVCLIMILCLAGCANSKEASASTTENISVPETDLSVSEADETATEDSTSEETEGESIMKLYFDDKEILVTWENNDTVRELMEEASKGTITVSMSMYSNNEQVGPLGRSYTRNDKQTTTNNGDIVLYSGDQIVVFYGSNSWSYTRLGKMDLSEQEVTELLSNGDITLKISCD